jgi:hypothetical protein
MEATQPLRSSDDFLGKSVTTGGILGYLDVPGNPVANCPLTSGARAGMRYG